MPIIKQLPFWIFLVMIFLLRLYSDRPVYHQGDRIRVVQRVASEPVRYTNSQRLVLAGLNTYLPLFPQIYYGDEVVVEGVVEQNRLVKPELVSLKANRGGIYEFRKRLIAVFEKSLPVPHSTLVSGVVLGSKSGMSEKFWEVLKKSGTAHVVVASGMNVTLVASFLMGILVLALPRRKAIGVALVGIWAYALMSGFDAPIIRAAVMGSIAFGAQALGKLSFAWRSLFLSALVMLIIRPEWISDLGFILSFTATASLMLFGKRVSRLFKRVPEPFKEGLSTSLAAQVGVAPILYATFGGFNLWSPVANALILWTIPFITVIGMVGGLVGLFVPLFGKLILYLSYPLTSLFIAVINVFG